MIRDFLGAVVGHVAQRDAVARRRLDIDRVESDSVADDGPALFQSRETRRRDGGIVPDDEGVGSVDLIVEVRISVAEIESLPKRFAEKIEPEFSEARRERGSAAGCVTDRTGAPGATPRRRISANLSGTSRAKRANP
jgi:hypothetical protein